MRATHSEMPDESSSISSHSHRTLWMPQSNLIVLQILYFGQGIGLNMIEYTSVSSIPGRDLISWTYLEKITQLYYMSTNPQQRNQTIM